MKPILSSFFRRGGRDGWGGGCIEGPPFLLPILPANQSTSFHFSTRIFTFLFHASTQVSLIQFFLQFNFWILSYSSEIWPGGFAGGVGKRLVCVQTGHEA
jgi:hypothetical protein